MDTVTPARKKLLEQAYNAFNNRDIDAVLQLMQPQVQWPNGWEGGWVNGHNAVRAYWSRQWQEIDPHVTPRSMQEAEDGTVSVAVHQLVKDKLGAVLQDSMVTHKYTFENGLVAKMEIES